MYIMYIITLCTLCTALIDVGLCLHFAAGLIFRYEKSAAEPCRSI
jgi:hypothetical protein